jgi:PAS domain S-box-containing protein
VITTQAAIDTLRQPIALLDRAGTIVGVNRAWNYEVGHDLGTPGSQFIESCRTAFGADTELAELEPGIREVLHGRRREYVCRDFRAAQVGTGSLTMRIRVPDGDSAGAVVVLEYLPTRDTPEQLEQFEGSATLTLDLEGNITNWSPSATKLFGYDEAWAIGENVSALLAGDSPWSPGQDLMSRLEAEEAGELKLRFRDASGHFFDCRLALSLTRAEKTLPG